MGKELTSVWSRLRRDQRGLSTVEYVILLCLIAAMSVGLWNTFGNTVHDRLSDANTAVGGNVTTVPKKK
ncbi:MAG TPA: hypothetical protein VHM19_05070 [Polyangiales bacterium]|jgi:Flp pilus assembly pilin Flp|nr:hypothetical protein [Polyangiales bacterium]